MVVRTAWRVGTFDQSQLIWTLKEQVKRSKLHPSWELGPC
jgi:hypothetical protein